MGPRPTDLVGEHHLVAGDVPHVASVRDRGILSKMEDSAGQRAPIKVGRYLLFRQLASGGMGVVHLGRMVGSVGFQRTVAVKRLHPHLATEQDFVKAFVDEARLASRVHHPNVVQTLDVVAEGGEVFLVMEFVSGAVLSTLWNQLVQSNTRMPRPIALGILSHTLQGLHAAHEAKDERGEPLHIIHRDVSPQNIIVGADGVSRVLDFGVAKADGRLQTTNEGKVKGKFAYMPPEHVLGTPLQPSADVYSASVVLWELLTNQRMFAGAEQSQIVFLVAQGAVRKPSRVVDDIPKAIEDIVMRGLERDPSKRFASAKEMALALERVERAATPMEVAEWLSLVAGPSLLQQQTLVAEMEAVTESRATFTEVAGLSRAVDEQETEVAEVPIVVVPDRRARVWMAAAIAALLLGVLAFVAFSKRGEVPNTIATQPAATSAIASLPPSPTVEATAKPPSTSSAPPPTPSASAAPSPRRPSRPATAPKGSTGKPGDGLFEWN
jgi:eukaryotic-like serine/threonine-protein kinase